MSFDWKSLLKKAAPVIAAAIPGGGTLAAAGISVLLNTLDPDKKVDPSDTKAVDELLNKAVLDPASQVKIMEAEKAFLLQMKMLDLDSEDKMRKHVEAELKMAADDRANARAREIAVRDRTPAWGFFLLTAGFFGLIAFFATCALKPQLTPNPEIMDILKIMVGTLGTAWVGAVQYYYGTTASSGRKDEMGHVERVSAISAK